MAFFSWKYKIKKNLWKFSKMIKNEIKSEKYFKNERKNKNIFKNKKWKRYFQKKWEKSIEYVRIMDV